MSKRSAWDRIDPTFAAMSFPPAGPYHGQQQPAVPQFGLPRRLPQAEDAGNWGSTPRDKPKLRKILQLLLHPVTGGPAGAETIAEAAATEGLPQHTTPLLFSDQTSYSRSWWKRGSLLVVDNRDERIIISPFQNWLVEEIISNAASSINVLTERDQVMPSNSGYHCLHARWYQGSSAVHHGFSYGRSLCSVGLLREQGSGTPGFSAFYDGRSCSTPRPPMWT